MNENLVKANEFVDEVTKWVKGLSERTLQLSAIAILHVTFLPGLVAYLNGITDKTPSLDAYIIVLAALGIMNLRAIIKKDSGALLIHLAGFLSQLVVVAFVLLK